DSVAYCRRVVLECIGRKRDTWTAVKASRPAALWLLWFRDRSWLLKALRGVPALRDTVPTIAADRSAVKARDSRSTKAPLTRGYREAAIRAYYRDREWLESHLSSKRARHIQTKNAELLRRLEGIRRQWFAQPGRPRKFTLRAASTLLGLSVEGLGDLLQR